MIGMQLDGGGGAVAVWTESGAEVIGRGDGVAELVAVARSQGADCSSGIVAVPAPYNDVERMAVFEQAKGAGIANVRLMNEPTAAVFAYGAYQSRLPGTSMVFNLATSGAFDVTLLAFVEGNLEVQSANGIASIEEQSPDQFFSAIEPVVNRALSDARLKPESLDAIIVTGRADVIWPVASDIESRWGRAPVEPPDPDTAIAYGAAVYGGFLKSRQ